MTREELLEAIGRVDDDLIQEAEDYRRPARRLGLTHWRPLAGGLAACLVLAATDGCLGYLQTPMEFEYYLLHAITQSETPEAFEAALRGLLGEVAGDDFTLAYTVTGMGDYAALRRRLQPRYAWMWKEMIEPLYQAYESGDAAQIAATKRRLWDAYRPAYQSQIAGKGER